MDSRDPELQPARWQAGNGPGSDRSGVPGPCVALQGADSLPMRGHHQDNGPGGGNLTGSAGGSGNKGKKEQGSNARGLVSGGSDRRRRERPAPAPGDCGSGREAWNLVGKRGERTSQQIRLSRPITRSRLFPGAGRSVLRARASPAKKGYARSCRSRLIAFRALAWSWA